MKQAIMYPCGWCRMEFNVGKIRDHIARCPKKPPMAQVTTRANWREMLGRRVEEIDILLKRKRSDINSLGDPWLESMEMSWKHLKWIYETKIRPKPAEPVPDHPDGDRSGPADHSL